VRIGSFLKNLFFSFAPPESQHIPPGYAAVSEKDQASASVAAEKISLDLRYRDFALSISRSRLKSLPPQYSPANPPSFSGTYLPSDKTGAFAPPTTDGITNDTGFIHSFLLAEMKNVSRQLSEINQRLKAIEVPSQTESSSSRPPFLSPHPGVVIESVMNSEDRPFFQAAKPLLPGIDSSLYVVGPLSEDLSGAHFHILA
jgi:hypothetical protein